MSTLQVANIWFESTANNRLQYTSSYMTLVSGGANNIVANSTTTALTVNTSTLLVVNATGVNAVTNTFNIGSYSNVQSGGYTVMPNGLKMNWGSAVSNATGSNTITFASAFTTNAYSLSITPLGASATVGSKAFITSITNSSAVVITGNNTTANVGSVTFLYMAIGPA